MTQVLLKRAFAAAAIAAVTATTASAATISADFHLSAPYGSSDYGNQGNSFSLTQGDLTATFAGKSFSSIGVNTHTNTITSATVQDGDIYRWGTGSGVVNAPTDNSHTVDGSGWDDFIEISFSQAVAMTSVEFSYFDAYDTEKKCKWRRYGWSCNYFLVDDDDFRWMYDASGDGALGAGDWISANENANPFTEFGSVTSSVFGFGAFDDNDDWKLKNISVEYEEISPVPLPASGLMLLAAFGGFAAMRRRKAANA